MGLETDEEVMHYLNARRTFSRDRNNLEDELENNLISLESVLDNLPDARKFLGEEETIWYGHQLKVLQKKGILKDNLGYALIFQNTIRPVNQNQKELKENLGILYYNQYQFYKGLYKIRKSDEELIKKRTLAVEATPSEEENERISDRLMSNVPPGIKITQADADFLDYYRKVTEYQRCIFAGLHPYKESTVELMQNIVFYTGVSSFMLALKSSIQDSEKMVKAHLGRWNM